MREALNKMGNHQEETFDTISEDDKKNVQVVADVFNSEIMRWESESKKIYADYKFSNTLWVEDTKNGDLSGATHEAILWNVQEIKK